MMDVLWMLKVLLMCEGCVMDALGMCYGCVSCIVNGIVSVMLLLFCDKIVLLNFVFCFPGLFNDQ